MTTTEEPRAGRPRFPAGYQAPKDDDGLLPWAYARERLEQAQNYWVATATADGRPHAAPVWAAWVDGRLYFEGSPETRWGRNLVANPRASVHLESGSEVVIVEGVVEDVDDVGKELAERVADAFAAKYNGYRGQGLGYFILVPRTVIGWSQFPADATRWSFGG
jgi:hypothetical protein